MSSGVKVAKECTEEYEKLKMSKAYRYIIYRLSDKHDAIIIDECGARDETYDQLKEKLLAAGEQRACRYAAFDLDFEFNGKPKNKIVFISWHPENSKVKEKMVSAASKDYLKKALQIVPEVQATDTDELELENVIEKARRGMKD